MKNNRPDICPFINWLCPSKSCSGCKYYTCDKAIELFTIIDLDHKFVNLVKDIMSEGPFNEEESYEIVQTLYKFFNTH